MFFSKKAIKPSFITLKKDWVIPISNQKEWFDITEYTSSCLLKLVLALP